MAWSAGAILTAAQLNEYVPQTWTAWTPTITAGSGTFTTVSGGGRYIQMGKTFFWRVSITITTAGTAAGAVLFTFPVTAMTVGADIGGGREAQTTGAALTVTQTTATQGAATRYDNATAIASGHRLELSGFLEVA